MIVHSRIDGKHLVGNLLGDPSERDLFVYLPPGYDESETRYPTAYLLHAFGSSAAQQVQPALDRQRWVPPLEDVLDPVFGRMGVRPMLVVVPDGWSSYGCGQWVDSPVSGNFEWYLLEDVVAHVDRHFRTINSPSSRGIFGYSSGGSGAWHLATRNPEVFGALAMLSGDSFLAMTHKRFVYEYLSSIWPEPPNGPVEGNDLSQLVYAYAACYSPNVDNPPYFVDLPVRFPSGELIAEVWNRWLSFDPVVNWQDRVDNLRKLSGILLDVGAMTTISCNGVTVCSVTTCGRRTSPTRAPRTPAITGRSRERYQVALQWLDGVLARH